MEAIETAFVFMSLHGVEVSIALAAHLASAAVGAGMAGYALVRIPEDYLESPEAASFWPERLGGNVGKNIVGVVLLVGGVVLAMPFVPGPGTLTAVAGLMLVDIPGKDRFVRRILGAPQVLPQVNRLRARFGRPPLRVPALGLQ